MLRCIECSGYHTGTEDRNGDGWSRCPACTMEMHLSWGADQMPPRNAKTGAFLGCTSKGMVEHNEMFISGLFRSAMAKVERESQYFVEFGVSAHSYLHQATENAIRF